MREKVMKKRAGFTGAGHSILLKHDCTGNKMNQKNQKAEH